MVQVYRGKLIEAEDNMNSQMASVTVTYRDGRVAQLENIYIRGSKIRFLILPGMGSNQVLTVSFLFTFPLRHVEERTDVQEYDDKGPRRGSTGQVWHPESPGRGRWSRQGKGNVV